MPWAQLENPWPGGEVERFVPEQRIYVASKFTQYARARGVMDALTAVGHTVTHDWTRTSQFDDDGEPNFDPANEQNLVPRGDRQRHARNDVRGVRTADVLLALLDQPSCGAPVEVGMALAYGVPVMLVEPWAYTVFWDLPGVSMYETQEQALASLGAV